MIFVTGGTGFLGRHLVPTLSKAGYQLRVLTRQPDENHWLSKYPNVEVVCGDLRTGENLEAVQGCDYVVHAAGLFSMWRMAGDFEATNVTGTENLLAAASRAHVKRLVYISTLAVIGNPQPNRIIDESQPPRPADPYQASKLKAEQVIKRHHQQQDIETIILRPGAFYGPMGDYAFNRLFFC
ncbi:MAG: NAD-dependent epimerase/dehydratase family protein [Anaerolineae bacterium]|nr:NAD-dependent epimerase/dehydratase family protein [Anaerolineae bacterium]